MEKKPRHLHLVHSQAESEVDKDRSLVDKAKSFNRFIKRLVGVTPVREATVSPEVESFRAIKLEEDAWHNGNGRY